MKIKKTLLAAVLVSATGITAFVAELFTITKRGHVVAKWNPNG